MSGEITTYINASLDEKRAYAQMLSAAKDMLPKSFVGITKDPETGQNVQAVLPGKILMIAEMGAMLGLHPMAAIQGIDVIEGTPSIKPALMSALVRQAGMDLRSWITGTIEGGDITAHAALTRPDQPGFVYESEWTPFDAIRAGKVQSYAPDPKTGLWVLKARSKNDEPMPWEAFTRRLLRWRVIGDVCSEGATDVLMGIYYTPDELADGVNDAGELVQVAESAPSEDWFALVEAAKSKQDLIAIRDRARADMTDKLRTAILTKFGMFNREPEPEPREGDDIEDAEIVEEPPAEETDAEYTDRLIQEGATSGKRRQCSIGYHDECSDRAPHHTGSCKCECHVSTGPAEDQERIAAHETELSEEAYERIAAEEFARAQETGEVTE